MKMRVNMDENITKEELEHISELSKLTVRESEKEELLSNLKEMLNFASEISSYDLSHTQKKRHRLLSVSELRDDSPLPPFSREQILSEAPTHTDAYVTIPRIIED